MASAILLDIEGTTTPIDFVHNTLFPFARRRIADFVRKNLSELGTEVQQLLKEHSADKKYDKQLSVDDSSSIADYLIFLIDNDRKSTPLKSIQGSIWEEGYKARSIVSVVYSDVPKAFARWKAAGKKIAIFSSGSVLAQKLIFKYSDHGDLTGFIDHYFDTNIGHKRERESYLKIVKTVGYSAEQILFVSDIPQELEAAMESGLQVALSIRPGNAEATAENIFPTLKSFDELE